MIEYFLVLSIYQGGMAVIPDRYPDEVSCKAAAQAASPSSRYAICVPAPKRDCHTIHNGSIISVPCQATRP